MRKCLVTGGTGLLGLNLVRQLVAEGWDVSVLSRNEANRKWLSGLPVRFFQGDVAGSIDSAVAGQEVVFHVGRRYRLLEEALCRPNGAPMSMAPSM